MMSELQQSLKRRQKSGAHLALEAFEVVVMVHAMKAVVTHFGYIEKLDPRWLNY